ncbi:helix-turn-helix domain-containing protein [Vibrio salinus]|uniref:helix-turn-helix domain-containing protein n=1 Tax=Vibrio salinus TaxID=2899784 RepID=UPI001E604AD4|nr:AraC family transcriptional regulator [Vibrio salinus]MCE0494310.1 AraC family transcriptional regulator [Vibrio salinus]
MIDRKDKHLIHWFGCELDKLPHLTGKSLFQHFYIQDKGKDVDELTDPAINLAFFYCRGNEQRSALQSAVKICTNLNKQLIVITQESSQFITKEYETDSIQIITVGELKKKETVKQILALFRKLDSTKLPLSQTSPRTIKSSMTDITQYIDNNLAEHLSIKDFARDMNYSISYFSKRFRYQIGISFQNYIINKRIELAKKNLLKPGKIAMIAYQCGYQDISYFSRIFKKRTGMTPQQYRNSALKRLDSEY